MLEDMFEEAIKANKLTGSFDEMMKDIYSTLYTGAIPKQDHTLVLKAREKVASMILEIGKNSAAVKNYL